MIVSSAKTKILHLEDQPADSYLVARILQKANIACELKVVSTRAQYLEALEVFKPELIISDHNMPSFNSIEALELLQKSNLKIPFVLVTGTVSEEFAVEAMQAGADDYILKDRMQRLPNAVTNALQKFQIRKEQEEAETRIKESEARYRSFFENSMDGILLTVTDGQILAANPAACAMFKMTEQEICEAGRSGLVDPADSRVMPLIKHRQLTGRARGEVTFLRKDGSKFSGEISSSLFTDAYGNERTSMIIRDVTERKLAEEKITITTSSLQKALGALEKVMASSLDMICAVNDAGYFLQVSAACETILGYTPDELIGKKVFNFVYPEDLGKTEQSARYVMAGNVLTNFENRYVRKDGTLVTISWSTRWDETERIRYGVARDVSKLKNAEKRYRQIVETAQEGIWVVDEHDKTTFVNSKLCELFEYTHEEMIGKEIYAFMDDEGKEIAVNLMQDRRSGKSGQGQFKYISKTGREIWTNISANPLFREDGSYEGALAMITDITEQKKIEEEIKKLSDVASLTVNAVIVTDPEGKITWVNKGFERITEYTLPEVVGKKPGDLLQGRDTDQATKKYMSECIKSGQGFRVEILNYSKSGRKYWLDIELRPLHNSQNKLTGFMAIEQDINEKKLVELERLALIDGLQNRNKELQQFSYIVSHNLRAPIAKILGLVSIMESESDENQFIIEKLTEEAAQLDNVVKDINTIVSARKSAKEKMESISLEPKLNLIKQVLEDQIKQSGATILADFSAAPEVWGLKSYLYSILYNLISNSLKYSRPGVAPHIEVRSSQGEKFICLSVKDNGEGIDLVKNKDKLFGLYKRFHTGNVPGKGIGLNLIKAHAESLGGRVEIESELAIGTTFRVYIPIYHEK